MYIIFLLLIFRVKLSENYYRKKNNYIISRFFFIDHNVNCCLLLYYYYYYYYTQKMYKNNESQQCFFFNWWQFSPRPPPSLRLDSKLDSNSSLSSLLECEKMKNNAAGADSVRIPFFRSYYYYPIAIYIYSPKQTPFSPFLPLP